MERLDLEVEIIPSAQKIRVQGRTLLRLEDASSDGPAFALNSRKKAMRFRRLTANGVNARIFDYKPEIEAAVLRMPRTFQRGDRLEVDYSLESEMESSQLVISQSVAFASWVENWYPIPATIEHGTASPAAPGSMTFRMPQGWRAVSNGALTSSVREGERVVQRWESDVAVARSFVAAPFADVESVDSDGRRISFYLLRERASAAAQAEALSRSLRAMEERFGGFPYPTYNVAEVPEGVSFAAASEQGFIMVRSSVLDNVSGTLPLFAHEAAHGWWGNLVRGSGRTDAHRSAGAVRSGHLHRGDRGSGGQQRVLAILARRLQSAAMCARLLSHLAGRRRQTAGQAGEWPLGSRPGRFEGHVVLPHAPPAPGRRSVLRGAAFVPSGFRRQTGNPG